MVTGRAPSARVRTIGGVAADQWPARLSPAQPGLPRRAQPQGRQPSGSARADHHGGAVRRRAGEAHGNRNGRRRQRAASGALLLGRLFDDRGNRMTPSTAKKGAIRYRYYVSSVLAQGRPSEAGSVRRASAPEIEALWSRRCGPLIRRMPISTSGP